MKRTLILAIGTLAVASFGQNLVQNGSFEDMNIDFSPAIWTSTPGSVGSVGSTFYVAFGGAPFGNQFWGTNPTDGVALMEFAAPGSTSDLGTWDTISQTLNTQVGTTYNFSFDYSDATNPAGLATVNGLQVSVNNTVDLKVTNFSSPADANGYVIWSHASYSFVGTGSDTIQFQAFDYNAFLDVDNVVVTAQAAPEPLPIAVFGLGLAAVLLKRSRA